MRTKRIGEGLGLLFAAGLFGASCGDGPGPIAPDPEKVTVEFMRAPADGSIFVQPAGPDTAFTFVFRATSSRLGALTAERVIVTVNGVEKTRGDSVQVNLPVNWAGIEVCGTARGQQAESPKACRTYKQYPRVSGRLAALLSALQPSLANRVVQFRSVTVRDSVRSATDASWVASTRAIIGDSMEVEMRGDATSFGSLDRVTPQAAASGSIGILLMPRRYCISEGSFAGQCLDNRLADFFRVAPVGFRFIGSSTGGSSGNTQSFRPGAIRIVFNDSIAKITDADTAAFMGHLREAEKKLGRLGGWFVTVADTLPTVGTIEVFKRPDVKSGVLTYESTPGVIGKCQAFIRDMSDVYLVDHEAVGHCLGLGHLAAIDGTCPFWSVMADGCGGSDELMPYDVAVIQQLRLQAGLRFQTTNRDGFTAAWKWLQKNGGA